MIVYDSSMPTTNRLYISQNNGAGHTVTTNPQLIFYTSVKGLTGTPFPANIQEKTEYDTAWGIKFLLYVALFGVLGYFAFQFIRKRWIGIW